MSGAKRRGGKVDGTLIEVCAKFRRSRIHIGIARAPEKCTVYDTGVHCRYYVQCIMIWVMVMYSAMHPMYPSVTSLCR